MWRHDRKLDLAARAAWLYYVAGNTQDQIAEKLNVSRQAAQRLVSLAVSEKLIKFRLDHPLAECMALAQQLRDRFGLRYCSVEPSDSGRRAARSPASPSPPPSILATYLAQKSTAGARVLDRPYAAADGRRAAGDELPRSTSWSRWSARSRATARPAPTRW